MPIDTLLERARHEEWSSALVTRFKNVCLENRIEMAWMLACFNRSNLGALDGVGPKMVNLAEEMLRWAGCTFGMFSDLNRVLVFATMDVNREVIAMGREPSTQGVNPGKMSKYLVSELPHSDLRATVNGTLERCGLRMLMPLDELFIYDPSLAVPVVPKALTVAEEIAAFMALTVAEVLTRELPSAVLVPTMTMGELALYLASVTDEMRETRASRELLHSAANSRLREETLRALCIPPLRVFSI